MCFGHTSFVSPANLERCQQFLLRILGGATIRSLSGISRHSPTDPPDGSIPESNMAMGRYLDDVEFWLGLHWGEMLSRAAQPLEEMMNNALHFLMTDLPSFVRFVQCKLDLPEPERTDRR